ncbi:MAG: M48 family metallopeptidase [Puniceicoccales bacterium]|jgi:Zn-dependent protease with chaperone function|nr:M48 family metallopeptidase [Puniceicoccales bacterium]
MNFFAAQSQARTRTRWLVLLFALAVLGVAVGVYALIMVGFHATGIRELAPEQRLHPAHSLRDAARGRRPEPPRQMQTSALQKWWNPEVALWTLLGVSLLIGLTSLYKWFQFASGGPAVAEMMGGRRIPANTTRPAERRLVNVVEEMSLASGVPVPRVYVLDDEGGINAFAAGLNTADAVVAVSRGALEQLNREELQAVVGHEFSHILNGDMRLNIRLAAILFGILALTIVGRVLLRCSGGSNSKKGNILPLIGIGVIVAGYLGYFFGRLIQSAVSRQREFLADASSVQFTRNPLAMANALNRIRVSSSGSTIENPSAGEISHFFFAQSFSGFFDSLFATHPPLERRIKAVVPAYDFKHAAKNTPARTAANVNAAANAATADDDDDDDDDSFGFGGSTARHATPLGAAGFTRGAVAPAAFMSAIGTLGDGQISRAAAIAHELPSDLRAAARDPARAATIIFGLLLDDAPAVRARQNTILQTGALDAALLARFADLDPLLRLPLLQIALGSLSAFTPADQDRLLEIAQKLADADGRVSIFEYALLRLLRHHIAALRNPRRAAASRKLSAAECGDAASVLLSFVARAGKPRTLTVANVFVAASGRLPALAGRPRLLPVEECNFRRLDAALAALAQLPPTEKGQILAAVAAAAEADGVIEPAELELVRTIACSLDCPAPL